MVVYYKSLYPAVESTKNALGTLCGTCRTACMDKMLYVSGVQQEYGCQSIKSCLPFGIFVSNHRNRRYRKRSFPILRVTYIGAVLRNRYEQKVETVN